MDGAKIKLQRVSLQKKSLPQIISDVKPEGFITGGMLRV
jgi:hypothetical protein